MSSAPVVLAAVGPISAAGNGREAFVAGLVSGAEFASPVSLFDPGDLPTSRAAEIRNFNLSDYLESAKTYLDRASAFALAASSLALRDGNLEVTPENDTRVGLCFGSMVGCLGTMRTFYDRVLARGVQSANSVLFSHSYVNTPISLVSIEFAIRGYHCTYSSGLTSGLTAMAHAADVLRAGQADVILAGGVDALCQTLFQALSDAGWLATDEGAPGWLLGEGAALAVMELESHVQQRGAKPLAFLTGAGLTTDVKGTGDGQTRAMEAAVREAGVTPADIHVLYLSANGDAEADDLEAAAVSRLFGNALPTQVRLKSRLGETLAAGGPFSVLAAATTLTSGQRALVNSFDPHGGCVSVVVEKGADDS